MNTINKTICVGAPNSVARYRNATNLCAPCFLGLPANFIVVVADNQVDRFSQCYVCEHHHATRQVKIIDALSPQLPKELTPSQTFAHLHCTNCGKQIDAGVFGTKKISGNFRILLAIIFIRNGFTFCNADCSNKFKLPANA